MNIYQKKVWELTREVIEICSIAQIQWFLSGRSAIRAYSEKCIYKGFLDCEITIPIENAWRFMQVFEELNLPNRTIESLINNPNFPGIYLKYVNTETTLVRLNEGDSTIYQGIFLKIQFLKRKPMDLALRNKANIYEELIYNSSFHFTKRNKYSRSVDFLKYIIKKKIYKEKFTEKIFALLVELYSDQESNAIIVDSLQGEMIEFERSRFEKLDLISYNDYLLHIPRNPKEYFVKLAGDNWLDYKDDIILEGEEGTMIVEGANNIVSAYLPYEQLLPIMRRYGLNKKLFKMRRKVVNRKNVNRDLSNDINKAWAYAERAGDFFALHDEYKNKKEIIVNLFEAGELYRLKEMLVIYDRAVRKYLAKNMCIFYDKELLDIYLNVLHACGEADLADHIRKLCNKDEFFVSEIL